MRFITKFMLAVLILATVVSAPAEAAGSVSYVYPQGQATFTVPAGQALNVWEGAGIGQAKVFKQVGGPSNNMVTRFTLETNGTVTNQETAFGPYTNATTIRIEAGPDEAYYSISNAGVMTPIVAARPRVAYTQFTQIAYTTAQTILASDMLTGIITVTHAAGANQNYVLPTGTLMDAATTLANNQGFEWELINLSGSPGTNTATVTAGTGHTIVGEAVVGLAQAAGTNSSRWFTRKTAANTFITYRLH